jgi:hypothetical protein
MRKLLVAIYGGRLSNRRAFFSGITRLAATEPRLSMSVYVKHVAERAGRMRTSPSAAFVQGARHFEAADAASDEFAVAR